MKLSKEVVKYGDDVLRETCLEVKEFNDEIRDIIAQMYDILHESNGVGLAGPQVGLNIRLFVYDVGEGPHALVNPKIVNRVGERWDSEGCLSIPGLIGDVLRSDKVIIAGTNENGKKVRIKASGLLSTCFQHETDHLDGVLFIDKADPDSLRIPKPNEDEESEEEV